MPTRNDTPFDDLPPTAVLRPKDIADRMLVDPRSVRRAILRGELRASRACGIRVLAADAAEWWRSRAVAPRSPVAVPPPRVAGSSASTAVARARREPQQLPLPSRGRVAS